MLRLRQEMYREGGVARFSRSASTAANFVIGRLDENFFYRLANVNIREI